MNELIENMPYMNLSADWLNWVGVYIPLKSNVWRVVSAKVRTSGPLVEFATSMGIASLVVFDDSLRSKPEGAPSGL